MKFAQLQPGSRFRFKGSTYTKTTTLLAVADKHDRARLIPQSAEVEPLAGVPPHSPRALSPTISRAQLDDALQQLAAAINTAIAESGLDAAGAGKLSRAIQAAFDATRKQLRRPL